MRGYTSIVLCGLGLVACASHRDVRPGADGVHHVITRGDDKRSAERDAIRQADHYCKSVDEKSHAAFVSDSSKYEGKMDEDTHEAIRRGSKAAAILGSGVGVFGGTRATSNVGGAVAGAGILGETMTEDDYTADMKFRCQ